jgi:hypothetical protein
MFDYTECSTISFSNFRFFNNRLVFKLKFLYQRGSWSALLRSYIAIFKFQQPLFSICLYYWSFWEQNILWYAVRIYFCPGKQIYLFVPTDRYCGMSSLLKCVARLHDQSNNFHRTNSNVYAFIEIRWTAVLSLFSMNAILCNKLSITCGK